MEYQSADLRERHQNSDMIIPLAQAAVSREYVAGSV
jgi:hypothetical protein